jgi:hypothetical protein
VYASRDLYGSALYTADRTQHRRIIYPYGYFFERYYLCSWDGYFAHAESCHVARREAPRGVGRVTEAYAARAATCPATGSLSGIGRSQTVS